MKNFGLIGVGGYIAPRHLKAIKDTGNNLVASLDPNDSVGILDSYFFGAEYFKEFEDFQYCINNLPEEQRLHYMSICTPNHLHKPHMDFSLREGLDVICEKPLVLTNKEIDELRELEVKTGKRVNTILQLRVHDSILKLKEKYSNPKEKVEIDLSYITSRGPWYHKTWKGNPEQSGGLPTNIGVHFFDMLTWIFGRVEKQELHLSDNKIAAGFLELEKAKVRWVLSIDNNFLPEKTRKEGKTTYRSIKIEDEELEFSGGFTDLHTIVYQDILAGKGYGLEDARYSIEIVEGLRSLEKMGLTKNSHPLLKDY